MESEDLRHSSAIVTQKIRSTHDDLMSEKETSFFYCTIQNETKKLAFRSIFHTCQE